MAYSMACTDPDLLAGIATVASFDICDHSSCNETLPVPHLQIVGTEDPSVSTEPGWTDLWSGQNGCSSDISTRTIDIVDNFPGAGTEVTSFLNCDDGVSTEFWKIEGGEHVTFFNENFIPLVLDFLMGGE